MRAFAKRYRCIGRTGPLSVFFCRQARSFSNLLRLRPCCNTDMRCIAWTGTPPDRALADRLRTLDIRIERDDPDDLPLVVSTATAAKLPAPRAERGRWVWLSGQAVNPARAIDAVLRGAYDVVALDAPDAMDRLVARLDELLTPDPPLPAA